MTIASLVPSTPTNSIPVEIDTAVLAKSFDVAEVSGQNMIKMMEQSVNPYIGGNIDYQV